MVATLGWHEIALRLSLTLAAGGLIGINRGERGRPAGLRTTLLVCLAASVAMIQANLLLSTTGKSSDSFVVFDPMRLPLGILSGIGFIGAGAILRRDDLVLGVTTAATLWFVTVIGLCFGGGQLALGVAALALALIVLWCLKWAERRMRQDRRATLSLAVGAAGPSEDEVRAFLFAKGFRIVSQSAAYAVAARQRKLLWEVEWHGHENDARLPLVFLTTSPGVRMWRNWNGKRPASSPLSSHLHSIHQRHSRRGLESEMLITGQEGGMICF